MPLRNEFFVKKYPFFTPFWPNFGKPLRFRPVMADLFFPSENSFFWVVCLWDNSIFLKKVKIGLRSAFFFQKSTYFLRFFTPFWTQCDKPLRFWPIMADLFFPPENSFFWPVCLWDNSIFLKKCKIELRNQFFRTKNIAYYALFLNFLAFFLP